MSINFSFNAPAAGPGGSPVTASENAQNVVVEGSRDASDVLRLAVAQMHCALTEGQPHVEVLTNTITLMHEALNQMRGQPSVAGGNPGTLASHEVLANQLAMAVMAVQFYDRLSQRMGHVRHCLELLEHALRSDDHSTQHWHQMLEDVRATYTMEDEKRVFGIVMAGGSPEDAAVAPPPVEIKPENDDNSIELF